MIDVDTLVWIFTSSSTQNYMYFQYSRVQFFKAYPGLKSNPLFQYFYTSISFKSSDTKTTIDPDVICVKIFLSLETSCPEITLEHYIRIGVQI